MTPPHDPPPPPAPGPEPTHPDAAQTVAAQRLGRQMKQLHRAVSGPLMKAMQRQLQGDDLSFSQVTALHQLRAHAPLSIGGLADLTGLSLPAASHLTDRLVTRGLAQRHENPEDRRAKTLALTPAGHAFLDDMDRRIHDAYEQAFAPVDRALIEAAADSLEAVLRALRAHAEPGSCAPTPSQEPA